MGPVDDTKGIIVVPREAPPTWAPTTTGKLGAYRTDGTSESADGTSAEDPGLDAVVESAPAPSKAEDGPQEEPTTKPGVFRVAVKESAQDANPTVKEWVDAAGDMFRYETRRTAEQHAAALGDQGGAPVAIQAAAPNDRSRADAYLVAAADRNVSTPANSDANGLEFDVEANQYGALGEALVTSPATDPPALSYYVDDDLDVEEAVRVRVESGEPVTAAAESGASRRLNEQTWLPDCVAVAERVSTGAEIRRYWCEIKTGDASFARSQTAVMQAKAAAPGATVLKARVRVEDLPDSYRVSFTEVSPIEASDDEPDQVAGEQADDAEIL
ncbi:MAG: hypothetical protein V5A37_05645 [Halobacteriales archaeon]